MGAEPPFCMVEKEACVTESRRCHVIVLIAFVLKIQKETVLFMPGEMWGILSSRRNSWLLSRTAQGRHISWSHIVFVFLEGQSM